MAVPWQILVDSPWTAGFAEIPEDASPPRVATPPHPDATGSYGEEAEQWAADAFGLQLRWWQRLALRRLLEHDATGELVWRTALVSTPRRSGKSTLLMVVASWRLTHGDLLGERVQTVVHTGQDRQVVTEVMRRAYRWAEGHDYTMRRAVGVESIEADESRWLMRSQLATYGYEVGLGIVDEAWAVPASVVDDGLEPGLLHRRSPQLLLTSTAHRRATSLMRRRLAAAIDGIGEDYSTLLLWWAAPEDAAWDDPETWRLASPYWTEQQAQLIGDRLERAMRGEADPQADDPDPLEGFKAQYMNLWPSPHAGPPAKDGPAVPVELWESAQTVLPGGRPAAAGLESQFGEGLALVFAYATTDGRFVLSAQRVPSAVAAADLVLASGTLALAVGKSLTTEQALREVGPVQVVPRTSTSGHAVLQLRRLLDEKRICHDGSEALDVQVRGLRVVAGTEGPRLPSGSQIDAVKAAVWAVELADVAVAPPQIF